MQASGWLQFALYVVVLALITKPMGLYLMQVLDANGKTWLDPVLRPLERVTYRVMGVDPNKEHDWKQYTLAMLLFSLVGCLFTYAILRLATFAAAESARARRGQPGSVRSIPRRASPPTPIGRATSAKPRCRISRRWSGWHSTTSSPPPPASPSPPHWFAALRGTRPRHRQFLGRSRPRHLLPAAAHLPRVRGVLVSQGMIQNFKPYTKATLVEPMKVQVEKKNDKGETIKGRRRQSRSWKSKSTEQNIVQGPMASQVAIKMLGTNGGGYVNANAAHPFENPTPLSNFIQMLSIFAIGSGLTYYLGRMVKNQKHGWTVWAAMSCCLSPACCLLVGTKRRQSDPSQPRRRRCRWQHGRQGSSLRHLQFRALRHDHHRCLVRRGQLHARFVHAARRVRAAVQHSARRNHLRRRRRGTLRNARVRRARGVHRRTRWSAARRNISAKRSNPTT